MKAQLSETAAKLYSKLYVSNSDIEFAQYCAGVLLKKGWHAQPWEKRGTIYQQQSAFTSALVTAYARPFTRSKGWPKFPSDLLAVYNSLEIVLHNKLIELRHTIYAHSDSAFYSIQPMKKGYPIVSEPPLRISASDATLFLNMTIRLLISINKKMQLLLEDATD
jgi:hypothetical protein